MDRGKPEVAIGRKKTQVLGGMATLPFFAASALTSTT
jgi:hypothetical protein